MRPSQYFDWNSLAAEGAEEQQGADARGRLRWVLAAIAACAAVVFARVVALECFYGEAYRREAAQPIKRIERTAGARGRILARDGTVLAYDRQVAALAVHYRYLEQPPNPRWLEQTARQRLPRAERRRRESVEAEQRRILAQRAELAGRLATLCGRTPADFQRRAQEIQSRVTRIAEHVNERRRKLYDRRLARAAAERNAAEQGETWAGRLGRRLADILVARDGPVPFSRISVAEEVDYHVLFEDLSLAAVAEIEGRPERYPGVRIVERRRRVYPSGDLAANVLGHLGPIEADELQAGQQPSDDEENGERSDDSDFAYHADDWVGRTGAERQFETALRGKAGLAIERSNRSGRVLSVEQTREPEAGSDLTLSIDPAVQRLAETLLDQTLARRPRQANDELAEAGGAVVALDVRTGAILAAASAPRYDPNDFAAGDSGAAQDLLSQPDRPLFDRAIRMAIPPGSVFKPLTAIALLEHQVVSPEELFYCQGYLHQPTRQRCMIYRRQQRGHESISLCDALAQSCNVYFFHFAERAGAAPLVAWAEKFGFGAATGVDLPFEPAGTLPAPATVRQRHGHVWRDGDTLALAIGQGELTATPLQVARLMAAVANGGRLVQPHLALRLGIAASDLAGASDNDNATSLGLAASEPIDGLHAASLEAVRRGLEQVVADPAGTGHRTVYCQTIDIAGKTGTAETGGDREDHAWFAGYAPAESPVVAFAVALEHAGSGGDVAGPIAKRLVQKMELLGYFRRVRVAGKVRGESEDLASDEPEVPDVISSALKPQKNVLSRSESR
jgi:penicillin-binding protein 2